MTSNYQVAIDGPAGAGKSTVAKLVAGKLNFLYIDTGAVYRAVTCAALERGIDPGDAASLSALAGSIDIQLVFDEENLYRVFTEGKDITEAIRSPEVSRSVSLVAKVPGVREFLLHKQREMARKGRVVMEGRDIGTRVIPDADFKFFLTASCEERARRRYEELVALGYDVTLDGLIEEIKQRDRIDSTRSIDPLEPAPDAVKIDCTRLSVEEVVDFVVSRVTGR